MAKPPSLRHQQRLQSIAVNRAMSQRLSATRSQNRIQRAKVAKLPTQKRPYNIYLMGKPKNPPPGPPQSGFPFIARPQFNFNFQFTPFPPFPPFQFRRFPPFPPFPKRQFAQRKQIPKIIAKIGFGALKLPLRVLKLLKPLTGLAGHGGIGGGGHGRFRGTIRNRRGIGPFRGTGLFGIAVLNRPSRRGIRIPTTRFRVGGGGGGRRRGTKGGGRKGRSGRRKGSRNSKRRVLKRRTATMRQKLERQRWGKAGMRAARQHRRDRKRRRI